MPMLESMDKRIQWLTVSKAADKSRRIRTEDLVFALAFARVFCHSQQSRFSGVCTIKPRLVWIKEVVL